MIFRENNKVNVRFYFLCILGRLHSDYLKISEVVRKNIEDDILLGLGFKSEGDKKDHEKWYFWKGKIKINGSIKESDIIIKHYKVRLIIEITQEYNDLGFGRLFSKAREEIELLKKIDIINKIFKIKIDANVEKVYSHPFVHIFKEYRSRDFDDFGMESITSFFYEVPDARRENLFSFLSGEPKKTAIRVSRPSVIATKMSNFMLSQVINALYDACLLPMRDAKIDEPSDKIFRDTRDFIGRVIFEHEETVANTEVARSVNALSFIMSIGAVAAILAILYEVSEGLRTKMGFLLLLFIIIIIISFFRLPNKFDR